ncbi:Membrane-associated protein gex-3, partial [Reticulomyxa filosa]
LYQDASHLDNIGTWITYLYLVFPEKLNDEACRSQLEAALNDRTVVILFRDELIDALAEYKNLASTSLATIKVPTNIIRKTTKNVNLESLTSRHRQMRELLRREIRGLLDLVHTLPGVIPVKLPVLMACLALARYEIFWLFTHMSLKNSKQNSMKDSQLAAPTMPDLMYQCLRLTTTILEHKELIYEYYRDQLGLDIKFLKPVLADLRKKDQVPLTVFEQIDGIVQTIDSLASSKQALSLEVAYFTHSKLKSISN